MNTVYHPSYAHTNTKLFVVHNTGGLGTDARALSQHLTAENVNAAHKDRFGMISSLGWWGGYNFYIDKDGAVTQFRAIGEETAAQRGHNFNGEAISVCLAGNFTQGVEVPTQAQIESLKMVWADLHLGIPREAIVPHRMAQSGTGCYGSGLTDYWARDVLMPTVGQDTVSLLTQLLSLYRQLLDLRLRMGYKLRGMLGAQIYDCGQADVRG